MRQVQAEGRRAVKHSARARHPPRMFLGMRLRAVGLCLPLGLAAGCWVEFPSAPDAGQRPSDASRPDARLESARDAAREQPGTPKLDEPKPAPPKPDRSKPDLSKPDAPKPAPPKPDASKPPPCPDNDGDTWTTCAGDCDDASSNVHPGQKLFFTAPPAKGSFDYDCDGQAQLQLPAQVACSAAGGGCSGEGWQGPVPACGKKAKWAVCKILPSKDGSYSCKVDDGSSWLKTQPCR